MYACMDGGKESYTCRERGRVGEAGVRDIYMCACRKRETDVQKAMGSEGGRKRQGGGEEGSEEVCMKRREE